MSPTEFGPPTPPHDGGPIPVDKVIEKEREHIARRRDIAFPDAEGKPWEPQQVADDLVGLALSGGGIRSAMFNLGLLQALHAAGLLRYVDYLSTVSGGSYIGAHLSSQMLRLKEESPRPLAERPAAERFAILKDEFPLTESAQRPQPARILQFIREGRYLSRFWKFAAQYLGGLLLNLTVLLSFLIFSCAALALLWRVWDQPAVLTVTGGVVVLLAVFLAAAVALYALGVLGHWLWRCSAHRRDLRSLALLVFILGDLALLHVWPAPLKELPGALADLWAWGQSEAFLTEALSDLTRAFLPTSILILAYFSVKGIAWLLDREAGRRYTRAVRAWRGRGDLTATKPALVRHLRRTKSYLYAAAWLSGLLGLAILLGDGDISIGPFRHLLPERLLSYDGSLDVTFLPTYLRIPFYVLLGTAAAAVVLLSLVPLLVPEKVLASGQRPKRSRDVRAFRLVVGATLLGVPLLVFFALARENVSRQAPQGKLRKIYLHDPAKLPPLKAIRLLPYNRDDPTTFQYNGTALELIFAAAVSLDVREAEAMLVPGWKEGVWQGQNEDDAVKMYPELDAKRPHVVRLFAVKELELPPGGFWVELYPGSANSARGGPRILGLTAFNGPDIRRQVTVDSHPLVWHDQRTRLNWLGVSAGLLLVFGLAVNLNWTSLHKFYSDRLREAYIEPVPGRDRDMPVSALDNVSFGAPYHLIGAAVNLIGDRRHPDPTDTFVFAAHYSGSGATHFWPTERLLRRKFFWPLLKHFNQFDDLAEVTAISGAAFSPVRADDPILAILMLLANARLGQWIDNPARRPWYHPRLLPWPNLLNVLLDSLLHDAEDRRRWFISDGGHDENLGLWPLIQRRCKVILVSDASQDPEHHFEDFLRLCRRIRLRCGIRFLDLDDPGRPIDLRRVALKSDYTSRYHYFIGRVRYPEDFPNVGRATQPEDGYLIYIKPSLTLDEEHDLLSHFHQRQPFPHDPTTDQLYDENTVESYRQLGAHIGNTLCKRLDRAQLWDPAHQRYDVGRKLFLDLLVGSLHELPPDVDQEEGLLLADEWEQDRTQAEVVLRRFSADTEVRRRWEEEVRNLLGGSGATRRPAAAEQTGTFSMARDLAGWAVACNRVLTERPAAGAGDFQPRGQLRLVKQVARHGRLLELYRQQHQWTQFFDYAASLAVGLRDGVFQSHGRETAAALILCLLAHSGFRPRVSPLDPYLLHNAIRDGDVRQGARLLADTFDPP